MKAGTRVVMSEAFKARLANDCTVETHVGPFDPEDPTDCWGCSLARARPAPGRSRAQPVIPRGLVGLQPTRAVFSP